MSWSVELLNNKVEREFAALPKDLQARYFRVVDLLEKHGPQNVGRPHVRHLRKKLWEIRLKGKDGIARAIYVAATRKRLIVLRIFEKKSQSTPKKELDIAEERMKLI